jgi:predicted aminopeptidase
MRAEYENLKATTGIGPAFERWFAGGANNASIVSVALYADHVPQFTAMLMAENGDLPRFYARVKALAALAPAERDAALSAVALK